jgi:hypothetical protein
VWIDDNIPDEQELSRLGLDRACCLAVDPYGIDALNDIQGQLSAILSQHMVPKTLPKISLSN